MQWPKKWQYNSLVERLHRIEHAVYCLYSVAAQPWQSSCHGRLFLSQNSGNRKVSYQKSSGNNSVCWRRSSMHKLCGQPQFVGSSISPKMADADQYLKRGSSWAIIFSDSSPLPSPACTTMECCTSLWMCSRFLALVRMWPCQ